MPVDILTATAIVAAGAAAGLVNAVVGSGTLVTFPTLLALGYPPVVANISNSLGLVVGGVSGSWGYRRELTGRRDLVLRLAPVAGAGGAAGALLLLALPDEAFETIVPVLIAVAVVLVLAQPRIAAWVARRRERQGAEHPAWLALVLGLGVFVVGTYGGYFGAAQGVLFIGLLGSLLTAPLQVANAIKNVISAVVLLAAAIVFVVVAPGEVDWLVVALLAAGSLLGGLAGAAVGRRLPAVALRCAVVVIGVVAVVRLTVA